MHRHESTPPLLGRHSLLRHILLRGLLFAGAAVAVVAYKTGALEVRPLLAAAGLSTSAGGLVQSTNANSATLSGATIASGDCRPFVCAAAPRAKWVSAPAANSAATEQEFRAPEPLVVRSSLTGKPYPAPDKPPAILHSATTIRGPGLAAFARPAGLP